MQHFVHLIKIMLILDLINVHWSPFERRRSKYFSLNIEIDVVLMPRPTEFKCMVWEMSMLMHFVCHCNYQIHLPLNDNYQSSRITWKSCWRFSFAILSACSFVMFQSIHKPKINGVYKISYANEYFYSRILTFVCHAFETYYRVLRTPRKRLKF